MNLIYPKNEIAKRNIQISVLSLLHLKRVRKGGVCTVTLADGRRCPCGRPVLVTSIVKALAGPYYPVIEIIDLGECPHHHV
ncbi:MAG: hypothetical protein WCF23_05345 [Candidatus Nitrosopolaris sp.]